MIRPLGAADLGECAALAARVHARDGYPPYLPTDISGFLISPDALGAWVAEVHDVIVGHVALHSRSSDEVVATAVEALGVPSCRLAVVARLLVDPGARRAGLGRALLEAAAANATARRLVPVLDVATRFTSAVKLYEKAGWTRVGLVTVSFPDDSTLDEYVYVGPQESTQL